MVKPANSETKQKIKLDGLKITKLLGRVVLPICQLIFVIVYAAVAFGKWNDF